MAEITRMADEAREWASKLGKVRREWDVSSRRLAEGGFEVQAGHSAKP